MARCFPASADMKRKSRMGALRIGRSSLPIASLVFVAGVLSVAATVAAARVPGSQAAYGPPPASAPVISIQAEAREVNETSSPATVVSVDLSLPAEVPAVSSEPAVGFSIPAAEVVVPVSDDTTEEVAGPATATSSTVESPLMVASSWSMSPLPEGDGGTVSSSTSLDPVTPTSSVTASPD